jgi:hypothetical protein
MKIKVNFNCLMSEVGVASHDIIAQECVTGLRLGLGEPGLGLESGGQGLRLDSSPMASGLGLGTCQT